GVYEMIAAWSGEHRVGGAAGWWISVRQCQCQAEDVVGVEDGTSRVQIDLGDVVDVATHDDTAAAGDQQLVAAAVAAVDRCIAGGGGNREDVVARAIDDSGQRTANDDSALVAETFECDDVGGIGTDDGAMINMDRHRGAGAEDRCRVGVDIEHLEVV